MGRETLALLTLLLYCSIRILPHKQNSGGFFVAVLHKKYLLRNVQNTHKPSLCSVREPPPDNSSNEAVVRLPSDIVCDTISDECAASATSEPAVMQNDSAVLDHTSTEPGALDSAVVQDSGARQQPDADNISYPGWFRLQNSPICVLEFCETV